MAHRKPLGTTFTSTFDWDGPHPELGDYLVSMADTWYLVVGVQEKANPKKVGLTLERIARPPDERVFIALTPEYAGSLPRIDFPVEHSPEPGDLVVQGDDGVGRRVLHFEWYPRSANKIVNT
jgi:hypothetical protein